MTTPTFQDCKTIEEVVFQAMGFASICWDNMEGTGEFDSTSAKECGEAAVERIKTIVDRGAN